MTCGGARFFGRRLSPDGIPPGIRIRTSILLRDALNHPANMILRVLTLCGSLRTRSSNRAMLLAYERAAPDMDFTHYAGIGDLPHFNPDLDGEGKPVPSEVAGLRAAVAGADALVISTPEYVHALPGAFKNALDWLVSDPAFIGKPVVILHRAHGSGWALESLREVLRTMSADVIEDATALLPLETNQIDETAILARDDLRLLLSGSAAALRATLACKKS